MSHRVGFILFLLLFLFLFLLWGSPIMSHNHLVRFQVHTMAPRFQPSPASPHGESAFGALIGSPMFRTFDEQTKTGIIALLRFPMEFWPPLMRDILTTHCDDGLVWAGRFQETPVNADVLARMVQTFGEQPTWDQEPIPPPSPPPAPSPAQPRFITIELPPCECVVEEGVPHLEVCPRYLAIRDGLLRVFDMEE
jgi:hypothetical protein